MIDRTKFIELRNEIIRERGDLALFALFLREDAEDRWDLLVSAPWLERNEAAGLRYLSKKLMTKLSERELLEISRVVLIEQSDPGLRSLLKSTIVKGGSVREIENSRFAGLALRHGFIFEAKPAA